MSYKIKDYMSKEIFSVGSEASIVVAAKKMAEKNTGYLIVLKNDQPAGIVTENGLVLKVMSLEKEPSKVKVSEVMSTPLITVDPDDSIEDAVKIMVSNGIRRLPVVKDSIIYGIFTSKDLAQHFNEYEDLVTRDIIKHMSIISLPL